MSRTENGGRHVSTEDVAMVLAAYRIPAAEREDVIAEAKGENASGWWDRPLPGVPREMGTLASYETEANSLTDWSVSLVPVCFRQRTTPWRSCSPTTQEVAELRWVARRRRQKIIGTVDYAAYISETALRTPFGGPEGHRKQLKHLLDAHERGIPIRVVPRRGHRQAGSRTMP
jgi:hypothetical protein